MRFSQRRRETQRDAEKTNSRRIPGTRVTSDDRANLPPINTSFTGQAKRGHEKLCAQRGICRNLRRRKEKNLFKKSSRLMQRSCGAAIWIIAAWTAAGVCGNGQEGGTLDRLLPAGAPRSAGPDRPL